MKGGEGSQKRHPLFIARLPKIAPEEFPEKVFALLVLLGRMVYLRVGSSSRPRR